MHSELTREDLRQALAGAPADVARLIERLTPVIQARVARGRGSWPWATGRARTGG